MPFSNWTEFNKRSAEVLLNHLHFVKVVYLDKQEKCGIEFMGSI